MTLHYFTLHFCQCSADMHATKIFNIAPIEEKYATKCLIYNEACLQFACFLADILYRREPKRQTNKWSSARGNPYQWQTAARQPRLPLGPTSAHLVHQGRFYRHRKDYTVELSRLNIGLEKRKRNDLAGHDGAAENGTLGITGAT